MADDYQAAQEALTSALAAFCNAHPSGEPAAFVLFLIPPSGTGEAGTISNLEKEGVVMVLEQYLDHARGQEGGSDAH